MKKIIALVVALAGAAWVVNKNKKRPSQDVWSAATDKV